MTNELTLKALYKYMLFYDSLTFLASIASRSRKIILRDRPFSTFVQDALHKNVIKIL